MRVAVIFILVSLLMLAAALTGLQSVRNKLTTANDSITQLKRDLKSSGQVLDELKASTERNERAQVVLREQIAAAHRLATRRNQTITRLLNENVTLRRWYQSALPDDVARLHARPEFATPDGYLRWLSEGQQLPDTGQPAENERRPER
jgi:LysB family phage lysis regulatory protein